MRNGWWEPFTYIFGFGEKKKPSKARAWVKEWNETRSRCCGLCCWCCMKFVFHVKSLKLCRHRTGRAERFESFFSYMWAFFVIVSRPWTASGTRTTTQSDEIRAPHTTRSLACCSLSKFLFFFRWLSIEVLEINSNCFSRSFMIHSHQSCSLRCCCWLLFLFPSCDEAFKLLDEAKNTQKKLKLNLLTYATRGNAVETSCKMIRNCEKALLVLFVHDFCFCSTFESNVENWSGNLQSTSHFPLSQTASSFALTLQPRCLHHINTFLTFWLILSFSQKREERTWEEEKKQPHGKTERDFDDWFESRTTASSSTRTSCPSQNFEKKSKQHIKHFPYDDEVFVAWAT